MNIDQNQYGTAYRSGQRAEYFQEYARSRSNTPENAKAAGTGNEEPKSYREQILEKMEEMAENIRKGTIQPKFQIGAQAFTIREWEKFLEKFDAAEEAIQEAVQAHISEVEAQAEKEAVRREAAYSADGAEPEETEALLAGVCMYSREEMELIQRAIMKENRKSLQKLPDQDGAIPAAHDSAEEPDAEEDDIGTQLVTKPDGSVVLQITTQYGVMELEVIQAQKFGLLVDVRQDDRNSVQNDRNQALGVDWRGAKI